MLAQSPTFRNPFVIAESSAAGYKGSLPRGITNGIHANKVHSPLHRHYPAGIARAGTHLAELGFEHRLQEFAGSIAKLGLDRIKPVGHPPAQLCAHA